MEIKQDGTGGQGRRKKGREEAGRKRRKNKHIMFCSKF